MNELVGTRPWTSQGLGTLEQPVVEDRTKTWTWLVLDLDQHLIKVYQVTIAQNQILIWWRLTNEVDIVSDQRMYPVPVPSVWTWHSNLFAITRWLFWLPHNEITKLLNSKFYWHLGKFLVLCVIKHILFPTSTRTTPVENFILLPLSDFHSFTEAAAK